MIYEAMRRSVFVCLLLFLYLARAQVSMPGSFSVPFRPFCGERAIQAVCRIRPNPNIDTDLYRDVHGMVILTQRVTCYNYYALQIKANIAGLPADGNWSYHGFHIHESGDFSDGCQSTGSHYNPLRSVHGAQSDPPNRRHVGGLGNVVKDPYGNIQAAMFDNLPSLVGDLSVVGRAIVLHEKQDDLGRGSNDESLRTGNAGRRIACCRIEPLF